MDEHRGTLAAILGVCAAAGAFILIAGLLAYSLVSALSGSNDPVSRTDARAEPNATHVAFVWTGGPYVRPPSALYIFVLCDDETVDAIYSGHIDSDYVLLRPTPERELIVALLEGRETIFPAHARIFKSACATREFAGSSVQ